MQKALQCACKLACATLLLSTSGGAPAWADQFYDAGLKSFNAKKYSEAEAYFEQSIKNAPWESNSFYYCALAYHYDRNFKKAAEKYADCAERFPGTEACNHSLAALKAIDPEFMKHRKSEQTATAVSAVAKSSSAGGGAQSGSTAASQDKGTIEGQDQTRFFYKINDRDKVVDVRVNGRATKAIFDQNGDTCFSRQQLLSMGINTDKNATEMKAEVTLGGVVRKSFPITVYDTGQPARIGSSFLDAFNVDVNETAKTIDLKRRSAAGSTSGPSVGFSLDGKILLVNVEVNGRGTQMIFDPDGGSDIQFTTAQARSLGLRVDDADQEHKTPAELPVRGEPGWVSPEDRAAAAKLMSVRMKLGPIERPNVSCKVTESGPKKPTFGPDFITGGGYKFDIDYKGKKIVFTRK